MRTGMATILTISATLLMASSTLGGVDEGPTHRDQRYPLKAMAATDLDAVRRATAAYHWLPLALEAGYVPFSLDGRHVPTCFDSEQGGMGVHYVRNVDDVIVATDPEALVYEVDDGGVLRLVAVEYVVPQEFVEDAAGNVVALPELAGQHFHKHATLPLYILHAWIWQQNPAGMFADFNPEIVGCPASATPVAVTRPTQS